HTFPIWKSICDLVSGVNSMDTGRVLLSVFAPANALESLGRRKCWIVQADKFRSVPRMRLPMASGAASVERRGGTSGIDVEWRLDGGGVVVWWQLQRFVLFWSCRPGGPGENPA